MMISPSPESEQPPMYSTALLEHVPVHPPNSFPLLADPSVETLGESRKGPSFEGFVPGEEMGHGPFGGLIRADDTVVGSKAERWGGGEFSLSEMKDWEFLGDLGKGLLVGDVGGGGGRISGGTGGVSAEMVVVDAICSVDGTTGVTRGSDEIVMPEMEEKLFLGDSEKEVADDGGASCQENEISLFEWKKKQLLKDLENGCAFGKVIGARRLENDDVSEGTLVLDKFYDLDGKKKVARESCADDSVKMKGSEGRNDGFDLRKSLKIEVIDDTAVVKQVQICEVRGMVKNKNEMRPCPKNQKEEVLDGKKARRARRKAKSLHRNVEILGKQVDVNSCFQNSQAGHKLMYSRAEMEALRNVNTMELQSLWCQVEEILGKKEDVNSCFQNSQASRRLMYSRAEMEALRYVNVVEQQKFWNQVYDGLGPVAKEYTSLLSERAQPGLGVDCLQQSLRWERGPGILGEVNPKQVSVELGNLGQNMNKVMGLPDPSCLLDIALNEGSSTLEIVESCEDSDNDNEYYAGIQRPAFSVDGEPNFNAGPPEDGLEYLRRVRWEAAHIPDVKVAKLDNRRLNKVQSVYMPEIPEIPDCPAHLLPLKQWEDAFLADFAKLRLALLGVETNSQQFSDKPHPLTSFSDLDSVELEDDQACPGNEGDGSLPAEEAASSKTGHEPPPRLSVVLCMDSVARVSMLKKYIKKAEAMASLSQDKCRWLFALCTIVDTPLDADTCAALRSLLRKCASLRAEKTKMDDEVVMLNILATIAGKYFGQSG